VTSLLRQAEEFLEIAVAGRQVGPAELFLLVDRSGGVRMIDQTGWSVQALQAEFGAASIFLVKRRGSKVTVEAWAGAESCMLQRELTPQHCDWMGGLDIPVFYRTSVQSPFNQTIMLQLSTSSPN
jgi:hypothetical protein